jgi:hypothetical protein
MSNVEILECLTNDIKLRGLSQNTLEEYVHRIRIFMAYFECPVEQLDEAHVKEFLLYLLEERKLKHGTVNTYNSALRFLYGVTLNKPLIAIALEYYMSLLPKDEAAVIKRFYFAAQSWVAIAENAGVVQRSLERRKKRGLEKLTQYYSILFGGEPNGSAAWLRPRFISYIHDERFAYCLGKANRKLGQGTRAMLYIISGCNELWQAGVETFFDFSKGKMKSDAACDCALTDNCEILLRLAYHLAGIQDRGNLISAIGCYFQDLEYVHFELATEAVKMVIFPKRH